jgi:hypothetical protein
MIKVGPEHFSIHLVEEISKISWADLRAKENGHIIAADSVENGLNGRLEIANVKLCPACQSIPTAAHLASKKHARAMVWYEKMLSVLSGRLTTTWGPSMDDVQIASLPSTVQPPSTCSVSHVDTSPNEQSKPDPLTRFTDLREALLWLLDH